jgi:hypothetical protein
MRCDRTAWFPVLFTVALTAAMAGAQSPPDGPAEPEASAPAETSPTDLDLTVGNTGQPRAAVVSGNPGATNILAGTGALGDYPASTGTASGSAGRTSPTRTGC